jgi:RimJ/RimL family protein N-acetyltransferase
MLLTQPVLDRPVLNQPAFKDAVLGGTTFVLERRVNQPSYAVARTLRDRATIAPTNGFALGDDGTLLVDDAPRSSSHPIVPGYESWRTTARLLNGRGRIVAHLDVEISTWAAGSVLIQLRPLDRSPQRWGARRTRRYFALAHAGADRLVRLLNEGAEAGARGGPLHDLSALQIRPIEPDDADGLRRLFWRMSPETRYFRFLSPVTQPGERCLHRLAEVDHRNRDALVATVDEQVVGVARYDRDVADPRHAEVAVVVEDAWHRHGIASALLRALTGLATDRGVEHFTATVAAENRAVSSLVRSFPVRASWDWDHGQRHLDIDLSPIAV